MVIDVDKVITSSRIGMHTIRDARSASDRSFLSSLYTHSRILEESSLYYLVVYKNHEATKHNHKAS